MVGTSAISLLAVFLTDVLTLTYISMLRDEALMAAIGIAKMLQFFNGIIVAGIVIGAGTLISRRAGQGRQLSALTTHALVLATGVAAAVSAVEWLNLDFITRLIGAGETSPRYTEPFIAMALLSSVLLAITQGCAQALRATGHGRRALVVVLSAAAVLVVIDPILIFGLDLELLGAGLASVLATFVSCILALHQVHRHIGLSRRIRLRMLKRYGAGIARIALPSTLGHLAIPFGITYAMGQLSTFGVSVMAGMALMDRVAQITYCLFFALPGALVPIFAQNLGALRRERTQTAIRSAARLVICYGLLAWVALAFAAPLLSDAFGLSSPGRELLLNLCRFGPVLWLVMGLDFIAASIFITLGQAWWMTLYSWLRASVGTVPFVMIGAEYFGASGVVLGMWLGYALVALVSIGTAIALARRHALFQVSTF
jgi:Na+-driven multidrug efflux pump